MNRTNVIQRAGIEQGLYIYETQVAEVTYSLFCSKVFLQDGQRQLENLSRPTFLHMNQAEFGLDSLDMISRLPVDYLDFPNVIYVADSILSIACDLM